MQRATEATVLGDFSGTQLEQFGVTTTFFRDGDECMVRTNGPDGAVHDSPISYPFGVSPLQQYLIAFSGGRYQAPGIAFIAGRKIGVTSADSTSILTRTSSPATRCAGPGR